MEKDIEQSYSKMAIEYEKAVVYLYNCLKMKEEVEKSKLI
jgi:hypothetical protein